VNVTQFDMFWRHVFRAFRIRADGAPPRGHRSRNLKIHASGTPCSHHRNYCEQSQASFAPVRTLIGISGPGAAPGFGFCHCTVQARSRAHG